jgi:hypothetical protein
LHPFITTAPDEPPPLAALPPLDAVDALCDAQAAIDAETKSRKSNKYRGMRKPPKFPIHRKLARREPWDNKGGSVDNQDFLAHIGCVVKKQRVLITSENISLAAWGLRA